VKQLIIKELVKPFVRRLGSLMAGGLITLGIADDQAIQIQEGLTALMLVCIDLYMSYWERSSS
jgi:hypothetical protein